MVSAFFISMDEMKESPITVIRYTRIDSTNRAAFALGEQGSPHGTVVVADEQTGGRGRQARSFASPRGGLYMSVILRPQIPAERLPLVTLAAGLAGADAVEAVCSEHVQLKWPNDLYAAGKKLGGILTETASYSHGAKSVPFIVIGIGLNVNTRIESLPMPLQNLATSLYCLHGLEYPMELLLHTLARELLRRVDMLADKWEQVLAEWRKRDYLEGKRLCWQDPQGWIIRGTGKGLLSDGRYLLTTRSGDDYPVLAGDITLTEINGNMVK